MFAALRQDKTLLAPIVVYYLMLVAFLVASYFPQQRLWGFSHWSYFPDGLRFAAFGIGIVFPLFALRRYDLRPRSDLPSSDSMIGYWLSAVLLTLSLGVAFYLLRARTHFLGDGYTLIANLASDQPIIKLRNFGVMMTHLLLYKWLPGEGAEHSLLVYRIVSFASGLGLCAVAFILARALFETKAGRLLFGMGLLGGGYSLQFFGYAEHYSMFIVAAALFTVVGMLVTLRKLKRWWIIPALALPIFLHIFGVTLIPAAVFAVLAASSDRSGGPLLKPRLRWTIAAVALAVAAITFYYFYSTEYFVRFALVPIVKNRFTADQYTLFSGRHLLDLVNLAALLLPGLPVLAAGILWHRSKRINNWSSIVFVSIAAVSTVAAAFVFDPKLGMARDWDLLSFCGVPVAVGLYYYAVTCGERTRLIRAAVVLGIGLSLLVLFSRAYAQVDRDLSIKRLKSYVDLDPQRGRRALNILLNYYNMVGDTVSAAAEVSQWDTTFPEWGINRKGKRLLESRDFTAALRYFRKAIELNPIFGAAYSNVGTTYMHVGQYDSARVYLQIANGMNPYSSAVLGNLGAACLFSGDYENAETYLLEAVSLDSTMVSTYLSLAMLYFNTGREDDCLAYLVKASTYPTAPLGSLEDLAALYYRRGEYEKAAEAIRLAIERGMDSSRVSLLRTRYPELQL